MANKRMFNKAIVDSDSFLDMPLSTQALYFHLNMRADDDGFIGNPKRIAKLIGASDDDLKLLVLKRFVLVFEDGVIVIKHWRMHNSIKNDRYTPTVYQDELKQLGLKENKSYTMSGNKMDTNWIQNGYKTDPKCIQNVSTDIDIDLDIGLDSNIDISKDNKASKPKRFMKPTLAEVETFIQESNLNVNATYWYDYYESNGWMVGKNHMKDWKACIRRWGKNEINGYKKNRKEDVLPDYYGKPIEKNDTPVSEEELDNIKKMLKGMK